MDILRITEDSHFDPITESYPFLVNSIKHTASIHYHDYYETFLIIEGSTIHNVNNEKQRLSEGALVFIRPNDIHYYEYDSDNDCRFINIPYTAKAVNDAFNYLGEAFCPQRLLSPKLPPYAILNRLETDKLLKSFERLHILSLNDKAQVRIHLRGMLIEMLSQYFSINCINNSFHIPLWLENLMLQMQRRENFVIGLPKMYELSGRTPGHLNKALRQHLSTTPTNYINQLRLDYARNLLITTNLDIIDISMESGFGNLSHFYHLFKKSYGNPPQEFRKQFT